MELRDAAGNPADTRTPEQVRALRELVERLHERFPNAIIVGHHDLNPRKSNNNNSHVIYIRYIKPRTTLYILCMP